jgi:plastocyanin
MHQRTTTTSLALLAAAGLALSAPALAAAPKAKTFKVENSAEEYVVKKAKNVKFDANDDPILTITSGDSLQLIFPDVVGDSHDMAYAKGDVTVWQTEPFASAAKIYIGPRSKSVDVSGKSLKKVISKPGTYKLFCTFHSGTMKMKLVVKKKKR